MDTFRPSLAVHKRSTTRGSQSALLSHKAYLTTRSPEGPVRIHPARLRTYAAQQPHALPNRASDATVPLAPPILITPLRVTPSLAARAPSTHNNMRDRLRMKDHRVCSLSAVDWTSVPFSTCGLSTCHRHGSPEPGHFGVESEALWKR
jgi:hypothetical protein